MRRGSRGNWKRPHQNSGRPPGLKGKEIGMYYKNKQKKKRDENISIQLEVPETVLKALHDNIKSIKEIAEKENIYLEPMELNFYQQDLAGADFIPIQSEKQSYNITNIIPRDDDVLFVEQQEAKSNIKGEPADVKIKPSKGRTLDDLILVKTEDNIVTLSDDSNDAISIKQEPDKIQNDLQIDSKDIIKDKKYKLKIKNYGDAIAGTSSEVLNKPTEIISTIKQESDDDKKLDVKPLKCILNTTFSAPSTSKKIDNPDVGKSSYKYGYDDIITGTFEEKLDECLTKGIAINMQDETINKQNEAFFDEYNKMVEKAKYKGMKIFRDKLPTFKKSADLLEVVTDNQVVVISGETGCGKSTQVPQIILDDAMKNKRGGNVKILVTQPRRIAASSLAMRIAEERAESMGNSVGYSVRLERVECRSRGSIMFCTTGVLLVELEVNQSLSNYSHIILDEVHERDCQIDIAMCMLKQVLKKRKDLKLIMMSATVDAETLCAYFDNCPMMHIEGLAYPVKDVYLEEILHMTNYQLPALDKKPGRDKQKRDKPWMKHVKGKGKREDAAAVAQMEQDIQYKAEIGPWLELIKRSIQRHVYYTLQDHRIETLNIELIFQLLLCITRSAPGAILVFLPGIAEITKLMRKMQESNQFPESGYEIHPLHSKLPTLTQHKIFKRPSGNIRKIIIATNIAETSITIDDIVYVVDCAKVKYNGLNVDDHVSTLQTEWASQANLRQRRGRAGRCQPGICYHLVSTYRASKLQERLLPELLRNDLLEPVLQIKRLRLGLADKALKMLPSVPDEKTIKNAVRHLQQCGALDENEKLTPLGWHMARLPVHPAAGKLLLLGALFGCLERAASVAAVWGFKDPFQMVLGKEKERDEAKKNLALGEPSDHIAISEALIQYENCESYSEKKAFAFDYFLSMNTLKLLSDMKRQFGENLKQMGFLKSGNVKSQWENRNTNNLALFKAIVAASLYPNIGIVRWKNMRNFKNPNKHPYINVRTPEDHEVSVHPSSVMANKHDHGSKKSMPLCTNPGANWLVYWLKQHSTALYLIEVTLVYTLPLLFFGELRVMLDTNQHDYIIDIKSIRVRCNKETTELLFKLRTLLDQVIASKIIGGGKRSSDFEENVLDAVKRLITAEDLRIEYWEDDQSDSDDNEGSSWY